MKLQVEELETISNGLKTALKYAKDARRVMALQGMYAESLVAKKLLENKHSVEFHSPPFDLSVDREKRMEVKCGKLWIWGAGASFGKGNQITENKFDFCVFVVIHADTYEPLKYFVFTLEELKECAAPRPDLTEPNTPCILFYYRDSKNLEESKAKGELVFEIEKELVDHPEKFENRWDKIS